MALLFEYSFYVGILLLLIGLIWLLRQVFSGQLGKILLPLCVLLLGVALTVGPAMISRRMTVDLGPRETLVQQERHITLTGWDRDSYNVLLGKTDTVVLQMANADVTDDTLQWLTKMSQLRELDLNDSNITDAGLAKLAKLPALETLRLRGTRITDAGFREHLMNKASLKQIDLRQTAVTLDAVTSWKSADETRRAFQ